MGTVTHNALEEPAENKLPALTNARQPAMPIIEQLEREPFLSGVKKYERPSA